MDALGETMDMDHPLDRQFFDGDQIELIYEATTVLVSKVASSPCDTLMHARHHHPTPLGALRCSLLLFAQPPLRFRQLMFLGAEEARISNLCPSLRVANVFSPTSIPACCPVAGRGTGSAHAHEKVTYHVPVLLREMVAVLGMPSKGRCRGTMQGDDAG
jgi:hypothetical protein